MPAITRDLNVIARCGNQFRSALLCEHGISAAQAPYILHICAKPGMSQEQLANALHVNPSNATRQLSMLENQGIIKRNTCSYDKRLIELFPTDKAIAAEPLIRNINRQWHDYLTNSFEDAELAALEVMLEKMRMLAIAWDKKDGGIE